jgi:DNA-binding NarL/FixJ family response regulator
MSLEHTRLASVGTRSGDRVALLVVDSHLVLADALGQQLGKEVGPSRVEVARSMEDAHLALEGNGPDILIVHDARSVRDQLGVLRELVAWDVDVLVLALSGSDDTGTIIDALRAGARGWVSKDMDLGALVSAIEQVSHGNLYLSPPVVTSVVDRMLNALPARSFDHDFIDSLSHREMEILRCLVAGLSKREIAARLFLSIHTVRSHVQRMLRRANQHSTLSLIALARQVGVPPIDTEPRRPHLSGERGFPDP